MIEQPELIVIAGPNGAGKTTFVNTYLPEMTTVREFVNADLIALGISPFNPAGAQTQAGRVSVRRVSALIEERIPFAWETTLSGMGYRSHIQDAISVGFVVKLFYVYLDSPQLSLQRIVDRVRKGGHDVPQDVVFRRYDRSLRNCFQHCLTAVDEWRIMDNSTSEFRPIASGNRLQRIVFDDELYNTLSEKYGKV